MMEKATNILIDKLLQRNIIIKEKTEIYRTGIMLMLADIINITIVLFTGAITNSLFWSIIYLVMMWTLRRFSGGFHAKTYGVCRIVTVGTYIIVVVLGKLIYGYSMVIIAVCGVFSVITMVLFAPVRHPNKKLTIKEIKANKLFSLITTFICIILSMVLMAFKHKEGLVIALILFAITVLMYVGMLANGKEGKKDVQSN